MKKKIVGREKPFFGKSVYEKAELAVAELVAKGYTIVDVKGREGGVFTETATTTIINMFRSLFGMSDIKDVVITIYYE
ncbi:MAG: hypothetical protein K2L70_05725 [Clostridia bacterium]|nr:hypothetical protein [Clostridia bacterium]